jgi:hypothetical protein
MTQEAADRGRIEAGPKTPILGAVKPLPTGLPLGTLP